MKYVPRIGSALEEAVVFHAFVLAAIVVAPLLADERVKKVDQGRPKVVDESTPAKSGDSTATFNGTIRTADGKPFADSDFIEIQSVISTSFLGIPASFNYLTPIFSPDGKLHFSVPPGKCWHTFALRRDNRYAPTAVGPFDGKSGGTINALSVVLDKGFSVKVKVIDEAGVPVANAHVSCQIQFAPAKDALKINVGDEVRLDTDADGRSVVAHAVAWPCSFKVTHPGFQPLDQIVEQLDGAKEVQLPLKKSHPIRGLVLSLITNRWLALE